jgi:hypothetical protein
MKKNYILIIAAALSFNTLGQTDRVTLIETFTSSTCGPCNGGNVNLENLLANATNDGKQVSLKYQMSWPGTGDPYFTDEGDIRRDLYVIGGIPASRLDGQDEYNTGSLTQNNLNTAYAVAPKAAITAFYSINEATQTVDISATVEVLENTPPGVRLFMAIFEYQTDNNVKSNGETEFHHVMKKMIPGASGIVMPPMMAGETYDYNDSYTFNGSYSLPANATAPIDHATEHSVEEFSDLGVAVWVQTISTREVYQAGYAQLSAASTEELGNPLATAKIYPNPTSDNATVAFHLNQVQNVQLELLNTLGQVVYAEDLGLQEAGRNTVTLELTGVESGLYSIRLASDKNTLTKRLMVE